MKPHRIFATSWRDLALDRLRSLAPSAFIAVVCFGLMGATWISLMVGGPR